VKPVSQSQWVGPCSVRFPFWIMFLCSHCLNRLVSSGLTLRFKLEGLQPERFFFLSLSLINSIQKTCHIFLVDIFFFLTLRSRWKGSFLQVFHSLGIQFEAVLLLEHFQLSLTPVWDLLWVPYIFELVCLGTSFLYGFLFPETDQAICSSLGIVK
jgi:hypothetical protein